MSVEVKRCCNSSIRETYGKIIFNSWIITLDEKSKYRYAKVVSRLLDKGIFDPETPDISAKILAYIFEVGLVHMSEEMDE